MSFRVTSIAKWKKGNIVNHIIAPYYCATVSFAEEAAATVQSSNIVGYQTIDAPSAGNFKAFAVQFENIGNTTDIKIPDLIQNANPKGAANGNLTTPDKIWLWDSAAGDWVKYYYRKVGTSEAVGWCKLGETTVTGDTIPAGEGFFFYRGSGAVADVITFTPPSSK